MSCFQMERNPRPHTQHTAYYRYQHIKENEILRILVYERTLEHSRAHFVTSTL